MTYSTGSVVLANDYNTFAGQVNNIWGTGAGDSGWGQTAIGAVSTGGIVTATNWATLVNNLAAAGAQTNTTITSRSAPTTGTLISILPAVSTDITNVTVNRGNAVGQGTTSSTWTGNTAKTSATGDGTSAWTISWTQTITFASANAARYFFNAGGLIRLDMSKTSTGTDIDADWNAFVGQVGTLYFSGRVNSSAQTIAGVSYTGTTRIGGTGGTQTFLASTTGYYQLTPGAGNAQLFQLNDGSVYAGNDIRVYVALNAGSTAITFLTTWNQTAVNLPGQTNNISGGTDTASPYSGFGTAPAVLCRYIPPSTTYLTTASWGTPAVSSAVS